MPSGICKLCLLTKDLRDSHLMPRSLYKKSRGSGIQGNHNLASGYSPIAASNASA